MTEKEIILEPCKSCGKKKKATDLVCPHCGRTDWDTIIIMLIISLGLLGGAFFWKSNNLAIICIRGGMGILGVGFLWAAASSASESLRALKRLGGNVAKKPTVAENQPRVEKNPPVMENQRQVEKNPPVTENQQRVEKNPPVAPIMKIDKKLPMMLYLAQVVRLAAPATTTEENLPDTGETNWTLERIPAQDLASFQSANIYNASDVSTSNVGRVCKTTDKKDKTAIPAGHALTFKNVYIKCGVCYETFHARNFQLGFTQDFLLETEIPSLQRVTCPCCGSKKGIRAIDKAGHWVVIQTDTRPSIITKSILHDVLEFEKISFSVKPYQESEIASSDIEKDIESKEAILSSLIYGSWETCTKEIRALGEKRDIRAVEPLITILLKHEHPYVRAAAANTLGVLEDIRAFEPLLSMTDSESTGSSAILALGKLHDNRAVEPLIKILKYGKRDAARSAAWALRNFQDTRIIEPLMDALKNGGHGALSEVIDTLGVLKEGSAVVPIADALKNSNDFQVMRDSVKALMRIGTPDALNALIDTLKSVGNDKIMDEAAFTLLEILDDDNVVDPFINALKDSDDDRLLSKAFIDTLARKGTSDAQKAMGKFSR